MTARKRRTFTVTKAKAFVGSVLGNDLGETPDQELQELTDHMEEHFAEASEENRGPNAQAKGVQNPKE